MSTVQTASRTASPSLPRRVVAARSGVIATAVVAAVAVNIALWLVGLLAGGDFTMTNAGEQETVAPGGVVMFTAVPMLVGLVVAALVGLVWSGVFRVAQWVGSFVALATIGGTIAADFDVASTVFLAAMHVALIVPLVWALGSLRRLQAAR